MRDARTTNEWPYHHKCAEIGAIKLQMCLCVEMLSELSSYVGWCLFEVQLSGSNQTESSCSSQSTMHGTAP